MISFENLSIVNNYLKNIAESIDLDKTRFEKVDASYHALGDWLQNQKSSVATFSPLIFPQGSFSIGTVVKPLNDDYDLDFVCLLEKGAGLSSEETYQLVGDRLKENGNYKDNLVQKNRCWRVSYAGDFHIDIIPAIPNEINAGTTILIPDRSRTSWVESNPKGYLTWFRACMRELTRIERTSFSQKHEREIEEIPDYFDKKELQMAIQLLKRHRDRMFQGENDKNKPISIIISTLSGNAYNSIGFQNDLLKTLHLLSDQMPLFVNQNLPRVPNPTNQSEDFADKWIDHPEREKAFLNWISILKKDLNSLEGLSSLDAIKAKVFDIFNVEIDSESMKTFASNFIPHHVNNIIFDLPHRKPLKWPFHPSCQVSIKAIKKAGVTTGVMQKEFPNDSSHLEKGLSLEYTAITDAVGSFEVQWQVVNTGYQAEANNQLRGDFYPSSGRNSDGRYRKESTSYTGMHWVEAFIIRNDICVARSGEFVIHIS